MGWGDYTFIFVFRQAAEPQRLFFLEKRVLEKLPFAV
jgi:hypothetical protein